MIDKGLDDIIYERQHTLHSERGSRSGNDEVRKALHRWQETAQEWSEVYRSIEQETGSLHFERKRQLRALEKRLNDAADAYERARQRADECYVLA